MHHKVIEQNVNALHVKRPGNQPNVAVFESVTRFVFMPESSF